jgi:hypothetical protein
MSTPNTSPDSVKNIPSRRSAASQAVVDRYASDPTAKRNRSLALAREHNPETAARAVVIDRGADGLLLTAVYVVPSRSEAGALHVVTFDPATDSAACDCAAGKAGLPCGHSGAAILAGRIADRFATVKLPADMRLTDGEGPEAIIIGYTGGLSFL